MTHDPTTSDSGSVEGMAFGPSTAGSKKRHASATGRRRVDLSDSEAALVDRTRAEIRELVLEVQKLGQKDCTTAEFYEGFLTRIVTALASVGGAIWTREAAEKMARLQFHVNIEQTSLANNSGSRNHRGLIERVFENGEPALVPPRTASESVDAGGNTSEHLLILGPIKIDNDVVGVVEIFQRAGAGPATQRGYLRFTMQLCEIASEFLMNQKLRAFAKQQKRWSQFEQFIQSIHQQLDVNATAYAIANEGRRIIDCDRVSVATLRGGRCVIKSVSGLDAVERRSEQVKSLGKLATLVVRGQKPLWFSGDRGKLPPAIEKQIEIHVDRSHARMIGVIPLMSVTADSSGDDPFNQSKPGETRTPIGALVVEQLNGAGISPEFKETIKVVAIHAQSALTNSIDHHSIFLMPLWKEVGKLTRHFYGARLARTATILSLLIATLCFLCFYPWQFSLGARGSLVPEQQREIYAQLDGILTDINVSNSGDSVVEKNQLLASMTSSQLELRIGDLQGRIAQARNERDISEIGKTTGSDDDERDAYTFQYERACQKIANLEKELAVQLKDRELLEIRAPIAGQVVNWQVRQNLLRRPVRFGQHLMTIVPPDTQWMIELEMPERRLAHLAREMERSDQLLRVTFALVSWPGREFEGELISVDQKLDVYSDEGNAALVRVRFANEEIPVELLRSGTRVTGKVHCGNRSIGYAMFYELIETVESKWRFWF